MERKQVQPSTPKAVQDCHDLLLWMLPHLDKLPKNRRYTRLSQNPKENPPPTPPFAKEGSKILYLVDFAESHPASPFAKGGLRGIFFAVFWFCDSLYTVGEKLENRVLTILESLVTAAYAPNKRTFLFQANRDLEVCRHLWRLCYDIHAIPIGSYQHGGKLMLGSRRAVVLKISDGISGRVLRCQ